MDKLKSFILVIDMPNLGGGTTFFMNSLITRYTPKTTFVIARNFNRKLQLSINNVVLKKTYSRLESVALLDELQPKISWIFVNHIIKHNKTFLQKLFKLDKNVAIMTHDYLPIFEEPHFTFQEYLTEKLPLQTKVNINQFNTVITQNVGNMYIYGKYMDKRTKENVHVFPLPDYTKSLEKINGSKSITVGILGHISYIKGSEIVKDFIKKTKNKNIKLVVFGSLEDCDYPYQFPYNGLSHLNRLLKEHQPNVMIETSICPETYSYTLTLCMLTQLPILYYRKPIPCVVSERLSHYGKSYECKSVTEMVDKSVEVSQNYLYTIDESSFSFNENWDMLFKS